MLSDIRVLEACFCKKVEKQECVGTWLTVPLQSLCQVQAIDSCRHAEKVTGETTATDAYLLRTINRDLAILSFLPLDRLWVTVRPRGIHMGELRYFAVVLCSCGSVPCTEIDNFICEKWHQNITPEKKLYIYTIRCYSEKRYDCDFNAAWTTLH